MMNMESHNEVDRTQSRHPFGRCDAYDCTNVGMFMTKCDFKGIFRLTASDSVHEIETSVFTSNNTHFLRKHEMMINVNTMMEPDCVYKSLTENHTVAY